MKILLINPKFPESFWSYKWALDNALSSIKFLNPPLGLATLAALCPDGWDVEIIDENVETIPLSPKADIVGICGMGIQLERQKELLTYYKDRGHFVVAGGSYASLCPESYESVADTVIAGEAEYIWKEFCRDYENGSPKALYQEKGVVSLADSPVPRFDLLKLEHYASMSMQFSRGCPFQCEFCDIIVMFGRKPRTKPLEQVGAELDALRKLGVQDVFFIDDNMIGNKKAAKDLLRFIRNYQVEHDYDFHFGTEASLDLAYDTELMRLFKEANFKWVFIGIESPDPDSLKETKKLQNMRHDILNSVQTIYAHGIDIHAGFIIGFDSDTVDIFEKQFQFIMASGIQSAMIGLLVAVPKTPLYERLKKEGRLISAAANNDNSKLGTNIIPKGMSYDEMVDGYRVLHFRLLEHKNIAQRIKNKARHLIKPPYTITSQVRGGFSMPFKFARKFLARLGVSGVYHFLRTFPLTRPTMIPLVVHDWIIGVAMRDYVERHFDLGYERQYRLTSSHLKSIRTALQRYLHQGSLSVTVNQVKNAYPSLSFSMKGRLGRDFFTRAARQLDSLLQNTRSSVTLRIDEFHVNDLHRLKSMLDRLHQYRERIIIVADEQSRKIINIDTSLFTLALKPSPVRIRKSF